VSDDSLAQGGSDLFGEVADMRVATIADSVYERVRDAIVNGRLVPGEKLVEASLARELRVSRTPLRDAFRRLERERLVERVPQGGVRVAPVTADELRQLTEVRASLEGLATRLAAERARTRRGAARAERVYKAMEQHLTTMRNAAAAPDPVTFLQSGRAFHVCILELGGNPWCQHMMLQVLDALERYRPKVHSERHDLAVDEHRSILQAILDGDPDRAERLMVEHLGRAHTLHRHSIDDRLQ